MENTFSAQLSAWLKNISLDRRQVIALLQQTYYETFCGLDEITLSRWSTNKVVPPIYKQLLIAKVLNQDLADYIINVNLNDIKNTKKNANYLDSFKQSLDASMNVLSYNNQGKQVTFELAIHDQVQHRKIFDGFYSNISALNQFRRELSKGLYIQHHAILLKNHLGAVLAHWSAILDIKHFQHFESFPTLDKEMIKRSCLVQLGYFSNTSQYFDLIVYAMCYYLLKLSKTKDYAYVFVMSKPVVEFSSNVFGGEVVRYYRPSRSENELGVYLMKFDLVRCAANPIIFAKVQERLNCIMNCSACGKCNANSMMSL